MCSQFRNFETPKRFKGRTGMQIFVDRFYREGAPPKPMQGRILKKWGDSTPNWWPDHLGVYQNDYFYGGNLKGIISKLDYIEAMGVNMIYLSPLGLSETSHHYEPIDQLQIDPWIGNWKDFQNLCEEAHARDILIVVDLVFNHMGIKSPIFQEAYKNSNSRYHSWFEWNHGQPVFWSGVENMPQCNKHNEEYQKYACEVSEYYLHMGADGIRLDLGENFPEVFMERLRKRVKSINPEAILVSEMWNLATRNGTSQLNGRQVDSVMNYPIADAILRLIRYNNVLHFAYIVGELKKYPNGVKDVLWNFLCSHDTPTAITMLAGEGMHEEAFNSGPIWDIEDPWRYPNWFDTFAFREWEQKHDCIAISDSIRNSLKKAVAIQYFMPGIPIVYAGTEIGMQGYKDPFNRKPYNWDHPDNEILDFYKKMGKFRKKHREFFSEAGDIEIKNIKENVLELIRNNSHGTMTLKVGRFSEEIEVVF